MLALPTAAKSGRSFWQPLWCAYFAKVVYVGHVSIVVIRASAWHANTSCACHHPHASEHILIHPLFLQSQQPQMYTSTENIIYE